LVVIFGSVCLSGGCSRVVEHWLVRLLVMRLC